MQQMISGAATPVQTTNRGRYALILILLWSSVAASATSVMNRKLQRGQTFEAGLRSMGVAPEVARRIIDALDDVVDLRRLRPGQQVRVVRTDDAVKYVDY